MRQLKIHTIPRSPGPIRTSIKRSTTVPRDGSQLTALRGAGFRKMGDVPHISQVRAPLTFSYVHAAQDQSIEHGRGEDRSRATSVTFMPLCPVKEPLVELVETASVCTPARCLGCRVTICCENASGSASLYRRNHFHLHFCSERLNSQGINSEKNKQLGHFCSERLNSQGINSEKNKQLGQARCVLSYWSSGSVTP